MSNYNTIQYRQVSNYNIPNLILPPEEAIIRLCKWGLSHKDYLEKHNRVFFNLLLAQGYLYQHCAEVENQARNMFETLVAQMKKAEGVTELLKEENQIKWICCMQNVEEHSKNLILSELIFK